MQHDQLSDVSLAVLSLDGSFQRIPMPSQGEFPEASLLAAVTANGSDPLRSLASRYAVTNVSIGRLRVQLALRDFQLFPSPKRSLSAASGALYLGRSRAKADGRLLQLLPPHVRTSRHFHKVKTERFLNLAGACLMGVDEMELDVTGCDYTVYPGTPHYLRTTGQPALNLLVISGLPDPLSMDDHHYLAMLDSMPPAG